MANLDDARQRLLGIRASFDVIPNWRMPQQTQQLQVNPSGGQTNRYGVNTTNPHTMANGMDDLMYYPGYDRPAQQNYNTATGDLASLMAKIAKQESGSQGYKARNTTSGALGKYQIMPGNLNQWGREAVGRPVSAQEFMANPQLQEQIATFKLGQYLRQYGPEGAAAAWYGGPASVRASSKARNRAQGAYPSINNYVRQVMGR